MSKEAKQYDPERLKAKTIDGGLYKDYHFPLWHVHLHLTIFKSNEQS
jgi:hypothetical protein